MPRARTDDALVSTAGATTTVRIENGSAANVYSIISSSEIRHHLTANATRSSQHETYHRRHLCSRTQPRSYVRKGRNRQRVNCLRKMRRGARGVVSATGDGQSERRRVRCMLLYCRRDESAWEWLEQTMRELSRIACWMPDLSICVYRSRSSAPSSGADEYGPTRGDSSLTGSGLGLTGVWSRFRLGAGFRLTLDFDR